MIKKVFTFAVLFVVLLNMVSAITGSIGNSRMVLRLEKGESVEKYILVKNVNDVPVTIELTRGGALADSIKLSEKTFTLAAHNEKKTYFTITSTGNGTTESKINVKFIPEDGSAVGLASTIIVIAQNGESNKAPFDNRGSQNKSKSGDSVPGITGNAINNSQNKSRLSLQLILSISSIILIIAFLLLLFQYLKKNSKKGAGRSNA